MRFGRSASLRVRIRNESFSGFIQRLSISNLRITFDIRKTLNWGANTANIRVWNLSQERRSEIKDYGDEITLYAGSEGDGGEQLLFLGDTTNVAHTFAQPEIISRFECGDGERFLNGRLTNVSYGDDISIRSIVLDMCNLVGLGQPEYFEATPNIAWENGFSFTGLFKDGMDKAVKALGLNWSIQNGKVIIAQEALGRQNPPFVINADSGMIGVPERFTYKKRDPFTGNRKVGWKVTTTLRPEIIPGDKVQIEADRINLKGLFTVDTVQHQGDTHGLPWYSQFEVVLL
jgi:hypothetical protein